MNVYKFFKRQGGYDHIDEVDIKTAEATQVKVRTIRTIKNQSRSSLDGVIKSPAPRPRLKPIMDTVDDFDKEAIRREILSFYERGELPTLDSLLEKVTEPPISFKGRKSTLRKIIRNLGFRYKIHNSSRAILMERSDIVASRNRYLREIDMNRKSENPRPEIFLDET